MHATSRVEPRPCGEEIHMEQVAMFVDSVPSPVCAVKMGRGGGFGSGEGAGMREGWLGWG